MDKDGSDGYGSSKNQQKYSEKGYSNAFKYEDERVYNPRPQGENNDFSRPSFSR